MIKQKGFAPIVGILVVVAIIAIVGGVWKYSIFRNSFNDKMQEVYSTHISSDVPVVTETSKNEKCDLSGEIILPAKSNYKVEELIISYGLFIETFANKDGSFCISKDEINKQKDDGFLEILTKISVMIPETDKFPLTEYLSAAVAPENSVVTISSESTAINSILTVYLTLDDEQNKKVRDSIAGIKEVAELGDYLDIALGDNPYFMRGAMLTDQAYDEKFKKAIEGVTGRVL